jgi:hypothetical protein
MFHFHIKAIYVSTLLDCGKLNLINYRMEKKLKEIKRTLKTHLFKIRRMSNSLLPLKFLYIFIYKSLKF